MEEIILPRQNFNLQGHEVAERQFLDAHNADRLHHAWMITGPRGIGKATLAYRMARFLMDNPPADGGMPGLFGEEPKPTSLITDPESPAGKLITAGSHGDLRVIQRVEDAKTGKMRANIVIDDVRKLQSFYNSTSMAGGWRIAIIDSADEMNRNSANALLKILEEPPKNSLLILLAHAPGRLLPTVRSRCRVLRLSPLEDQRVADILRNQFPDLGADEISGYVALANGSPGYAISLVHHEGLKIYAGLLSVLSSLPSLDIPAVHTLASGLATKKAGDSFILFGEMLTSFINRLVHQQTSEGGIVPVLSGEIELMEKLGANIPLDHWARLWEKISEEIARTDALNMDRKQVVLNMFTMIAQALRAPGV